MQWSDACATGIPRIDEQHRLIFETADEYRMVLDGGQGARSYERLLELLERYIHAHLGFEERCMEEYKSPAAAANREAHRRFDAVIAGLRRLYGASGFRAQDACDLLDNLDAWFAQHIARIDVQLRGYVER